LNFRHRSNYYISSNRIYNAVGLFVKAPLLRHVLQCYGAVRRRSRRPIHHHRRHHHHHYHHHCICYCNLSLQFNSVHHSEIQRCSWSKSVLSLANKTVFRHFQKREEERWRAGADVLRRSPC